MGKGGETSSTVKLPPEIEKAALDNLELAKKVGSLPYAPYFGPSVAAFAPAQEASFKNADQAAGAFGLPGHAAGAMPKPINVGGFRGYSTEDLYKDAMGKVPPEILAMYQAFFGPQAGAGGGAQPPGMNPVVRPGSPPVPTAGPTMGNPYYNGGH